jgi:hypothetical protein
MELIFSVRKCEDNSCTPLPWIWRQYDVLKHREHWHSSEILKSCTVNDSKIVHFLGTYSLILSLTSLTNSVEVYNLVDNPPASYYRGSILIPWSVYWVYWLTFSGLPQSTHTNTHTHTQITRQWLVSHHASSTADLVTDTVLQKTINKQYEVEQIITN